ncbi:MAG: DUF3365 domain-containing protein [Gammaproteobacteria bacterium]|nr:DUF3365 domain-containing protein [Gammaproteobacteria bacterium]NIR28455.1 DUF3365 domain-containing protein [Gammaproteobacteria bacterium]NIR96901.1 DUF3365 domain-containing protein [Gammaproteobacteria bacterium]NIT62602.1 DUF3365 domain-containing protein [Gammaproteobacteria bacterium]NIV19559.1 DUF3365 domain-containing protein [Gammaproteobacteria bacterium]
MAGAAGLALAGGVEDQRVADSRITVEYFMGELKGALLGAMTREGPAAAIEVCNRKAPALAAEISHLTGWRVGRTSLKPRNPNNAPDAWERRVLKRFEHARAQGADPRKLEFHEMVKTGGGFAWRYMKAIPTGGVCLSCHGSEIAEPVSARLQALYPEDPATGFQVGDVRGAFSITQPIAN